MLRKLKNKLVVKFNNFFDAAVRLWMAFIIFISLAFTALFFWAVWLYQCKCHPNQG